MLRPTLRRLAPALLGLLLALPAAVAAGQHVWLDASGQPLPFDSNVELLDFLATAEVVEEKPIGTGINQSVKLTLERDGVRAHAIFREADVRKETATVAGETYRFFADSYKFECAAYELGRLIGLERIPPVVLRRIRRRDGSVQLWLEDALDEDQADFRPPRPLDWVRQIWDMNFFDSLVYNIDRNPGNILVDQAYRLWMIDHTRGFQFRFELLDETLSKIPRGPWERLMALSENELREVLGAFLTSRELQAVIERRKTLATRVEELLDERPEDVVFY